MGLIINKFNKNVNKKDKNLKMITNHISPNRDSFADQHLGGKIGEAAKKIEDTAKLKEIDEVTEFSESEDIDQAPPEVILED